jgi:phosphotransferase system enzyme I (PtsI)
MNLRQGGIGPRDLLNQIDESSVLIADELTPSLAAQVDWTRVRGFATDAGSRTYHTAILARSLEVPAVVGLHDASRVIQPGQLVVIDGDANEVIVDPDQEVLSRAARAVDDRRPATIAGESERSRPARTADGVHIRIEANIELADELAAARYAGAEGVGLYRSEFLLTGDAGMPDEDEQYAIYRGMLEGMAPDPVTIRTFDVGEERLEPALPAALSGARLEDEERAGGRSLRGLRLSLRRPEVFEVQLRALLRAARHGTLRIMFPFVSGVAELRAARQMVVEAAEVLRRRGEDVPAVPLGAMIEVPAAAYTADLLATEVEFLTIGTNDLIQYCLAVNRADETVSEFYEPLHPAVLRMIQMVRRAADRRRIPVSLCGEMAADPALLPLLVGLGLTELSMTPGAIATAKRVLGEVRRDDMRALARRILRLPTAEDVERELIAALGRNAVPGGRTGSPSRIGGGA